MLVLAAFLTPAAPAVAQEELPENNAGTGEYVEPVPDAGGDRPADPRDGGGTGRLPPGVRDGLPGGDEGRVLERLATDPGSGAQDGTGDSERGDSERGRTGARGTLPSEAGEDKGAVDAVVSAAVDPDNPGVSILFLAVGGITLGALAIAVRRRRRS